MLHWYWRCPWLYSAAFSFEHPPEQWPLCASADREPLCLFTATYHFRRMSKQSCCLFSLNHRESVLIRQGTGPSMCLLKNMRPETEMLTSGSQRPLLSHTDVCLWIETFGPERVTTAEPVCSLTWRCGHVGVRWDGDPQPIRLISTIGRSCGSAVGMWEHFAGSKQLWWSSMVTRRWWTSEGAPRCCWDISYSVITSVLCLPDVLHSGASNCLRKVDLFFMTLFLMTNIFLFNKTFFFSVFFLEII